LDSPSKTKHEAYLDGFTHKCAGSEEIGFGDAQEFQRPTYSRVAVSGPGLNPQSSIFNESINHPITNNQSILQSPILNPAMREVLE
jgi:hypothetical protein